jgi:predicted DNA-binding transcriptional regulator YafY
MKTPPLAAKKETTSSPAAESPNKRSANRNSSRFAQWRQHEMHARFSAHFEAYRKNHLAKLWNRNSLAAELGCKPKTIGKDIATMKDSLGYPLEFYPEKHGWMYTESFAPVLAASITKSELTRLFFAVRAVEALQDSPVFAPVLTDLQKLISALIDRLGLDYESLSSCVTIKNTGIDPYVDTEVLEKLIIAIRERQELEIVYSKLNYDDEPCVEAPVPGACDFPPSSVFGPPSSAPSPPSPNLLTLPSAFPPSTIPHPSAPWLPLHLETRIAHPLHIFCLDNVWYLYLWDPMRKAIRRFMLSRMHAISRTGESFKPRKFNVKKLIANSFGVTSGEPVTVRVQFRGKASYLVAERPWHHTQQLAPGPDTEWNLEATLNVALTPELTRWIFGYDQDARVIEPAALRDAIAKRADGIQANYDSE